MARKPGQVREEAAVVNPIRVAASPYVLGIHSTIASMPGRMAADGGVFVVLHGVARVREECKSGPR